MPTMLRQGDLLLIGVTKAIPGNATSLPRPEERLILARGEASGHAHAIAAAGAQLFQGGRQPLLRVSDPAGVTLSHEEHAPLHIPFGVYEVVLQRRFLPGGGSAFEPD